MSDSVKKVPRLSGQGPAWCGPATARQADVGEFALKCGCVNVGRYGRPANAVSASIDYSVQALTDIRVTMIDNKDVRNMTLTRPSIARALWIEAQVETFVDHYNH